MPYVDLVHGSVGHRAIGQLMQQTATSFQNDGTKFQLDDEVVAKLAVDAELDRMRDETLASIEADKDDPTKQDYIQRLDTKALIKDDKEFALCLTQHVPMRRVSYKHALHILAEVAAAKRNKIAKRTGRKVSKASRKKSR